MGISRRKNSIRNESVFIGEYEKIIGENNNLIKYLFESINSIPFSYETIDSSMKIKTYIIKFFNKINHEYNQYFRILNKDLKNYYCVLINEKWDKKFDLLLSNLLNELEKSDATIHQTNYIIQMTTSFYKTYVKHTILKHNILKNMLNTVKIPIK